MLCAFALYIVNVHLVRNNPRFLIILTFGIQIRFNNKISRSERIPCAGSYHYKCSNLPPMSLLCPHVPSLYSLMSPPMSLCQIPLFPPMSNPDVSFYAPKIPSYVPSPYSLCLLYVPSYVSSLYPLLYPLLYPSYVPSCTPSLCPLLCLFPISPPISLPTSDLYLPSYLPCPLLCLLYPSYFPSLCSHVPVFHPYVPSYVSPL